MTMYDRYKHDMLALGMSLTRDRGLAEDAVQDVFVNLARRGPQLRIRGRLRPYLLASVANRVRNLGRGPVFTPLTEEQDEDPSAEDPAGGLVADETAAALRDALNRLPEEQREIVLLHLQHDLRIREIADMMAIPVNTAKSRYRYGVSKLRQLLNGAKL